MDYSFPRYLLSKQTVDDRALNKDVVDALRLQLPPGPVSVVEAGAGIGTMLRRLINWELLCRGEYLLVDSMEENIAYAREWIPRWAAEAGLSVEESGPTHLRLFDRTRDIRVRLVCADIFEFARKNSSPADILIAHAFLDLYSMPQSLEQLMPLTKGLAWLTVNFDGVSTLLPAVDCELDERIERLYHATMDKRATGGDSRMGRKMFDQLRAMDVEILGAGASDWVVYGNDGRYPADEKYFLQFILHFFESSLRDCNELEATALQRWLAKRHDQVERGELVYIAHQMDYLVGQKSGATSS